MMLTTEQLATFKAAMIAETDPELVGYRTNGQTPLIYQWYNSTATPEYVVWRNAVTKDDLYSNGFDWVQIDNVTEPKWRVWNEMFWDGSMDPSKPNIRAGIDEVWKGTAAKLAVGAYVLNKCKRAATRIEQLFSTGSGTTASPSTVALDLSFSEYDVTLALAE